MRKVIRLQDLDCASCAQKIENAIARIDGVFDVKVNFLSQRMTLEAADDRFDAILAQAQKAASKIERDILFLN